MFSTGYNWSHNKKSGGGSAEKKYLTEGFIKVCFSSLASDLDILVQWILLHLLVHGSKEIGTWLTSLGRQDFLGKEKQDDQNGFPGKEKSETEAGENEQAVHCSLQQLHSGVLNGTWDS